MTATTITNATDLLWGKVTGVCHRCHERPATNKIFPEPASGLDIAHGARPEWWCDKCTATVQLTWCLKEQKRIAKWIPKLRATLKKLNLAALEGQQVK